jgi:hypothetical protein
MYSFKRTEYEDQAGMKTLKVPNTRTKLVCIFLEEYPLPKNTKDQAGMKAFKK